MRLGDAKEADLGIAPRELSWNLGLYIFRNLLDRYALDSHEHQVESVRERSRC